MEDYKVKVQMLKDEKGILEKRLLEIKQEMREIQKTVHIEQKYELQEVQVYMEGDIECIRITQVLTNENEKDEYLQLFGSVDGGWEKTRHSVDYFRIEGLLLHDHGGWILLKDRQLCSDEEWNQIKNGNIPEKFLR